jgi:hypothetical protein
MATFGGWLQTLLINNATVGYELSMLAKKPSSTILNVKLVAFALGKTMVVSCRLQTLSPLSSNVAHLTVFISF